MLLRRTQEEVVTEDRACVTYVEGKQGCKASCTNKLVVETMDLKLTGKYIFETGSSNRDRHYRLIYRLRKRFMFNFAGVREDPRPIVPLLLCLFIALTLRSMI